MTCLLGSFGNRLFGRVTKFSPSPQFIEALKGQGNRNRRWANTGLPFTQGQFAVKWAQWCRVALSYSESEDGQEVGWRERGRGCSEGSTWRTAGRGTRKECMLSVKLFLRDLHVNLCIVEKYNEFILVRVCFKSSPLKFKLLFIL